MSLEFIPTIWSARLLAALNNALIYSQAGVVNKDYEGEIKAAGNTVKIASIGEVNVGNYTRNEDIGDPQTLSDSDQTLLIDQAKFFNFQVDDVDKAQQNVNMMESAMRQAAFALRDRQDTYVAGLMAGGATAENVIGSVGTPVLPTKANAYEYLVDLGVRLDESNTPTEGRYVVVPPFYHGLLQKDDRFVKSGTAAGDSVLRNGSIGQAAGFTVYQSNKVPNTAGSAYRIIAGHPLATTVAEQIVSIETYRMEKRFANAVKGLHVYGGRVIRPNCLAVLIADRE